MEHIQNFLLSRGLSAQEESARLRVVEELQASPEEVEEFFGHGPLLALMQDESVTEILVNGPAEIWCERGGKLERCAGAFANEESLRRYVRRLLAHRGRKVDLRAPFADSLLEDGSRVHVAVPPVAKKGICVSIRKFRAKVWTLAELETSGMMGAAAAAYLREAVAKKKNIFVSGSTGAGKTTLLGALLSEVSAHERIVALEDIAELRANHPHFLSLEARPPNQEGEGQIALAQILREALRMRPDRLVVGECRGVEALDLLLALNTGHAGSMGTIHANAPREALQRLETLALLAAENIRESTIQALLCASIEILVHLDRSEGQRKITAIAELKGMDGGKYLLRPIPI